MAANITVIPGADPVDFYLGNYNYADILTDMDPLKFHWAVDRDSLIVKNAAGTTFDISRPYQLWKPDGSAVSLFADADGHLESVSGLSSTGNVSYNSKSGRSDAQLEFVNNGAGHAMLGSALLQNPGVTTHENAWSGQGYDSAGNFVQMGAFYMRWGSTDPNTGWSTMGIHPNYLSGGSPVADVAFEVYGARGIGMFLDHNAEGTVITPPVDRYLMIKRAAGGKPSICGVTDMILDANFGGAANTVYLNAYNAGDVNACVAGGTLLISGGAVKILGTNAIAKFAPTGVDEHWIMADYIGNIGIYNNTDGIYELHINTSHNVGIGTYNQAKKLEVLDVSGAQIRTTYTNASVFTDMLTNSNGYFSICPTGNRVGINTTTPTTQLDIKDTTSATTTCANILTVSRESSGVTDHGFGAGLNFSIENPHGAMRDGATIKCKQNAIDEWNCDLEFWAYKSGSVSDVVRRMAIDGDSGYVGLNTSSAPVCPLEVYTESNKTTTIQEILRLKSYSSATTDTGFGARLVFETESYHGAAQEGYIDFINGAPQASVTMRCGALNALESYTYTYLSNDEFRLESPMVEGAWVTIESTGAYDTGVRFYTKPGGGSRTLRQKIYWQDSTSTLRLGDQSTLIRIGTNTVITAEGGCGNYETAGENLSKGEAVCYLQGGTAGRVYKCPTSGNSQDMPIGIVYAAATTGNSVIIIKSGMAEVLPEAGLTLTQGYVISVSTSTAGRLTQENTPSAVQHWRECGHVKTNGSGNGALTLATVHFN